MSGEEILIECLRHFAYNDRANAAIHMRPVRYSSITFRVAEMMNASLDVSLIGDEDRSLLRAVLADRGAYTEDGGR